jgi:hypothetical protein
MDRGGGFSLSTGRWSEALVNRHLSRTKIIVNARVLCGAAFVDSPKTSAVSIFLPPSIIALTP